MMGYNHVASGLLAGLLTVPMVPMTEMPAQVGWVLGVGGAALVPDFDSPSATASRMWGPITGGLSSVVSSASGGHRRGTHDLLLGPSVAALLVVVAALHHWSSTVVLAILIGLALRGLVLLGAGNLGKTANLAISLISAVWLTHHGASELSWILAVGVAFGMAVHIAGDALTTGGIPVPLLWLFRRDARVGLGLFGTDSAIEKLVVGPLLSIAACFVLLRLLGIGDLESVRQWFNQVALYQF